MSRAMYRPLTLGEILVIVIGCGLGALCIVTMTLKLARKQMIVDDEVKEMEDARAELEVALNRPRKAITPLCLPSKRMVDSSRTFDNESHHLSKSQPIVLPPPHSLIQISGLRDSWPLVSAIEMPGFCLPPHPTGSVVAVSQRTPMSNLVSGSGQSYFYGSKDGIEPLESQREPIRRSSNPGRKISNVIRSASQHVKSARTNSVRALKTIGFAGPPPNKKLPPNPVGRRTGQFDQPIAPRYICATQPSSNMVALAASLMPGRSASRESNVVYATHRIRPLRRISPNINPHSMERRDGNNQAVKSVSNGSFGDLCRSEKRKLSSVNKNPSRLLNRRVTMLHINSEHTLRTADLNKTYRTISASDPVFLSTRNSSSNVVPQGATIPRKLLGRTFASRSQKSLGLLSAADSLPCTTKNDFPSNHPLRNKSPIITRTASAIREPGLPRELSRDILHIAVAQKMTMNSAINRKIPKRLEATRTSSSTQRSQNTPLEHTLSEVSVTKSIEEGSAESLKSPTPTIGSLIEMLNDFASAPAITPNQCLQFSDLVTQIDQDSPTMGLFESSVLSTSYPPNHDRYSDDLHCLEQKKKSPSAKQRDHKGCRSDGFVLSSTSSEFHSSATILPRPNYSGSSIQQCLFSSSVARDLAASPSPSARMTRLHEGDKLPKQLDSSESISPSIICKKESIKLDIHEFRRQYQKRLERNRVEQKRFAAQFVADKNQIPQYGSEADLSAPQTIDINPLRISGIKFPFLSTVEDMAIVQAANVTGRKAVSKLFDKEQPKTSLIAPNTPVINSFAWQDFRTNLNASSVCQNRRLEYHSPLPFSRKQLESLLKNTDNFATDEDSHSCKSTASFCTRHDCSLRCTNLQNDLERGRLRRCFI